MYTLLFLYETFYMDIEAQIWSEKLPKTAKKFENGNFPIDDGCILGRGRVRMFLKDKIQEIPNLSRNLMVL